MGKQNLAMKRYQPLFWSLRRMSMASWMLLEACIAFAKSAESADGNIFSSSVLTSEMLISKHFQEHFMC